MNVRLLPAAVASVFCFSCVAAAQQLPQVPAKTGRTYVLLVPGKGVTTLQPVSGIEDIPFNVTCLSFSKISVVHDGGDSHIYAIDAQEHSRGRTKQAERVELLLGERGVSLDAPWAQHYSKTEESNLYRLHYYWQSHAGELDMAQKWMILDQRRLFQEQLGRSSTYKMR